MDNLGSWYVSIWPLFLVLFLLGIVWCVICLKSDQSILIHCLHYVVASKSSWVSIYSPVGSGRNWVSSFCVLSLGFHLYLELVCSPVLICVKISCLFGSPLYGWINAHALNSVLGWSDITKGRAMVFYVERLIYLWDFNESIDFNNSGYHDPALSITWTGSSQFAFGSNFTSL